MPDENWKVPFKLYLAVSQAIHFVGPILIQVGASVFPEVLVLPDTRSAPLFELALYMIFTCCHGVTQAIDSNRTYSVISILCVGSDWCIQSPLELLRKHWMIGLTKKPVSKPFNVFSTRWTIYMRFRIHMSIPMYCKACWKTSNYMHCFRSVYFDGVNTSSHKSLACPQRRGKIISYRKKK